MHDALGILVIGYNRPYHLQSVLESLRLQDRLEHCHVWLDGTQGRGEFAGATDKTEEIARRYAVKELRTHWGHLGIEKLMLDALGRMAAQYPRVLVLEDDCFPVEGAIDDFDAELEAIRDDESIFSVYGHHFGLEPSESRDFSRFQGWGWAAHSGQIGRILPTLWHLFRKSEQDYVDYARSLMTPDVRRRLEVTPGRNVTEVITSGFSWDSAVALVAARMQMNHRRTPSSIVLNTGLSEGIGHFQKDCAHFRKPPFNMIRLDEAFRFFDRSSAPCDYSRETYGLDELDLKILDALPIERGFFVEIGANDGVTQSNSVILEKRGWKGLLIEAIPETFARCWRQRPAALVEHAACVSRSHAEEYLTLTDVGLMSLSRRSGFDAETRDDWLTRGEGFARRARQEIDVPAVPISALFDKHGVTDIDLLILDVEGAEIDVLEGLDFSKHAPSWIVAEDAYGNDVASHLAAQGYELVKVLLERKHTRDCLYRLRSA